MESDHFSSHPPCKRRAGWNGLQGLQMLVIEHTTESGEAASEVMNSSSSNSNLKTTWVELSHMEPEWKSQRLAQPRPCRQPGYLPGHEHYARNPASNMPRRGWRHFFNGEIVLHAQWYRIANSQLKLPKWRCFFLVFKYFNSQSLILSLIVLLYAVGNIYFQKLIKTSW